MLEHSDSPLPFPLCFVAFAQRYRGGIPRFALTGGRTPDAREPGPVVAGGPSGDLPRRPWGLPGSWISPCALAVALRPRGISAPGRCGAPMLPPRFPRRSAPPTSLFRGSITQPSRSLSTLRRTGCPATTQDSLPAGGQPCRAGLPPAGLTIEGFRGWLHSLPPSPGLTWRKETQPGEARRALCQPRPPVTHPVLRRSVFAGRLAPEWHGGRQAS
jgi:hypothetical protein